MATRISNSWKQMLICFLIGGGVYLLIEVVWRMLYQHRPTNLIMMLPAGTVFATLWYLDDRKWNIFLNALIGMLIVTCFELVIGLIAIHVFDTHLWDYGGIPGEFMDVICPRWSMIWYGMCFGCILVKRIGAAAWRKWKGRKETSAQ